MFGILQNRNYDLPSIALTMVSLCVFVFPHPTSLYGQDAVPAADTETVKDQGAQRIRELKEAPVVDPRKEAQEKAAREAARKRGEFTFDDLKFDIEKGGKFERKMLPDSILDINKKTIRIRGYILPSSVFQQTGIKRFVLVRDDQECCFGPGAAIYDCIMVEMEKGKSANFATRSVTVNGKFEIDDTSFVYADGTHIAIFKMTATEVK